MKNKWLFIGALSGFLCIALGAFATHGLASILDEKALEWIDTGLKYQMFHTLALIGLGFFQIANQTQNPPACRAKAFAIIGVSWTLGIVLFSGSLYLLALGSSKALVWLTPIGGTAFLVGWAALLFISAKGKKQ